MPYQLHRDVRSLLQPLLTVGYRIESGGKHWLLRDPDGNLVRDGNRPVPIHKTPGDNRSMKNLRAQLRRAGCPLR